MIATVTLNPSLDKTVTVERLVLEEANRWTSMRRDPGGKGINVSRVVHELRGKTIAYGFMGGIDGNILKQLLQQQGVPFDFTTIKGDIRSNLIITNLGNNSQTRIDAPGPTISKSELGSLIGKITHLEPKPDYLVLAGSVPPGIPDDIYKKLIDAANEQGIKTVLDSDERWLKEGIKAKPALIKPNVYEAGELLGTKLKDEPAIVKAVKKLLAKGIEIVAISRGKDGLIISDGNKMLKVISPKVQVRSTVGAGDSTVAALVLSLTRGDDIAEASRLAVAAGTATTLTPGTELCRRRDVEKLLPQVKIKRL
jgi:6-phosphofructokinase 2